MAGNSKDVPSNIELSYEEDSRIPCKYGLKCYQKNPSHGQKYKHPQKRESSVSTDSPPKKMKESEEEERMEEELPKDDLSKEKEVQDGGKNEEEVDEEKIFSHYVLNKPWDIPYHEEDLPASPEDVRESIKQKFLVEMPEDFYSFWNLCETLNQSSPSDAFKECGLYLVGPYDALAGKLKGLTFRKLSLFLRHWRYYYDPPEFLTVLRGNDKTRYHMGYFRDDPKELPVFIASNKAAVDGVFKPVAENMFGAVNEYLEEELKTSTPFTKVKLQKLQTAVQKWAKEHDFTLDKETKAMKERKRNVVAKTFSGLGIVVPYNRKTQRGYRPIPETEGDLRKIFEKVSKSASSSERSYNFDLLQDVMTNVQYANDEGDCGMGLEFGLDMFAFGGKVFHSILLHILPTAYTLLKREEFKKIIEAHLLDRRQGVKLDIREYLPDSR